MRRITRHLNPAMIIAIVALVSSLTGGAIAASMITGKQIRNASVTGADIRNSSLTGADVKNRSLTGTDIRPGSLGADRLSAAARASLKGQAGPQGPAGPQGAQGPQGIPGPSGSAGVTQTAPAGALAWNVIDLKGGTNKTSGSPNGGFVLGPEAGDTPRTVVLLTTLPSLALNATTGTVAALHVCYRARNTVRLNSVSLQRYRGDNVDVTGLQSPTTLLTDTTERQDTACRRYAVTGPTDLRAGDTFAVGLELLVTANGDINANRFRVLSLGVETTD